MLDNLPWLPYLVPPLLGALIGYVTNYIAIRMLFRPLHPWRLLGMRLGQATGTHGLGRLLLAVFPGKEFLARHRVDGIKHQIVHVHRKVSDLLFRLFKLIHVLLVSNVDRPYQRTKAIA